MLVTPGMIIPIRPVSGSDQPPQYMLYQNGNYGFSMEYPAAWYHTEKAAISDSLAPVAYFAPDSQTLNTWFAVNYQKDAISFQSLSGPQIVNALTSAMNQNCQRNSFLSLIHI